MNLILTVTTYRGKRPVRPMSASFGPDGGIIGRAADCTWVLPDPSDELSKRHCQIMWTGGTYRINDTSTNGVFLNDQARPLGKGCSAPLTSGDRLSIGDYMIEVQVAPSAASQQFSAQNTLPSHGAEQRRPGASWEQGIPGVDPPLAGERIAPLFDGPPAADGPPQSSAADWRNSPVADHAPIDRHAIDINAPGVNPNAPASILQQGWNPFLDGLVAEPAAPGAPSDRSLGGHPPEGHGSAGHGPAGHGDDQLTPGWNPFADTGPHASKAAGAAGRLGRSAANNANSPVPAQPRANAPAPSKPPSKPPAADAERLLRAFLDGAGLPADAVGNADPEAVMRAAGRRLRALTGGLRELLIARSQIKNELRVAQTVFGRSSQNPLKFSSDDEQAILALLVPRGSVDGDQAIAEAFKDMKQHEFALLAGARNAISSALSHFDPTALAARLANGSQGSLAALLPMARKARYWELFESEFRRVAEEAEEDAHGPLARALARAYEEQSKK